MGTYTESQGSERQLWRPSTKARKARCRAVGPVEASERGQKPPVMPWMVVTESHCVRGEVDTN